MTIRTILFPSGRPAPVAAGYGGTGDFSVTQRSSTLSAVAASGSGQFTRIMYTALTDIAELRLLYANWYAAALIPDEVAPANSIDVTAYIEPKAGWWRYISGSTDWNAATAYTIGQQVTRSGVAYVAVAASTNSAPSTSSITPWRATTAQPVSFSGQSATRAITIAPGAQVVSEPFAVQITKGDLFAVSTLVIPTGGTGVWPTGFIALSGGTPSVTAPDWMKAGATDFAATPPTTTTTDQAVCFHPVAVLGRPAKNAPRTCVAMIGDSITAGQGDASVTNPLLPDPGGWQARLFATYPNHRIARTSDLVAYWVDGRQRAHKRVAQAAGCSHAVVSIGVNDLHAGSTVATIQSQLIELWRVVAASVPVVYATTITPETTSTDAWATVGNQTAGVPGFGVSSNWSNLNAWLLDGAALDSVTFAPYATGTSPGGTVVRAGMVGHPLSKPPSGYVLDISGVVCDATITWAWKVGYTTDGVHPSSVGAAAIAAAFTASALLV